jgi:hypothetical protein
MLNVCYISLTGKTDPYVVMTLGDQVIKSKKNSQTTVIGLPGEPIWNQVKFNSLDSWVSVQILFHVFHCAYALHHTGFSPACCKSSQPGVDNTSEGFNWPN